VEADRLVIDSAGLLRASRLLRALTRASARLLRLQPESSSPLAGRQKLLPLPPLEDSSPAGIPPVDKQLSSTPFAVVPALREGGNFL
jgi:hypothetical protein